MCFLHAVAFSKKLRWYEPTNVTTLKIQQYAVNACWKRLWQRALLSTFVSANGFQIQIWHRFPHFSSVIEDTTSGSREVPSNEDGGVSGWLALPAFLVLFDDRPFLDDLRLPVGVVPELLDRWTFLGLLLKDGEPTMVPLVVRLMAWRTVFEISFPIMLVNTVSRNSTSFTWFDGLILGLSRISLLPQLPHKIFLCSKVTQK